MRGGDSPNFTAVCRNLIEQVKYASGRERERQKEREWALKEKLTPKQCSVDLENRMEKNICDAFKRELTSTSLTNE